MLEELSIRNYVLIDNLSLSFDGKPSLNIITGETGAGKSIIVGSLSLILGAKASQDSIRTGAEEASISAVVHLKGNSEANKWLKERDIEAEDDRVIIRRNIKAGGRSPVYIQNIPVNRAELAAFCAFLFDIHGQHEHESLLNPANHRKYLDRFAGLDGEVEDFGVLFSKFSEKRKMLEALVSSERKRADRIEYLSFAIEEIGGAKLKNGESKDLKAEKYRLSSYEKLVNYAESASAAIYEEGASVLSLARKARASIESAAAMDESLSALAQRFSALYFEAEDLAGELRSYRDKLQFNPARLEEIEDRLSLINKLKKKYVKGSEDDLIAYKAEAEAEIEALSSTEEDKAKLKEEISALEKEIARRARELSAKRKAASTALSSKIVGILQELGMPSAKFGVQLEPKQGAGQGSLVCGPTGADDVEFLISANKGEPLKELSRIASGGELSRVMLAIKTVFALNEPFSELTGPDMADISPETLIFDEIDAGIGGEVAVSIGKYLYKIAQKKQVFCITHLASIACRATNHILVEKKSDNSRTTSSVRVLKPAERRFEIARMLSGSYNQTALAHADELLAGVSR